MKLRIVIVSDTSRVRSMLNQSNLTTPQQTLLKKRLDYLNIVDVRLNELREDFNAIQKMAYTVKNLSL